jgi:hypothetical protein
LAALDEMMMLISKYYVEKFAKEVLQEIDCGSAGLEADRPKRNGKRSAERPNQK